MPRTYALRLFLYCGYRCCCERMPVNFFLGNTDNRAWCYAMVPICGSTRCQMCTWLEHLRANAKSKMNDDADFCCCCCCFSFFFACYLFLTLPFILMWLLHILFCLVYISNWMRMTNKNILGIQIENNSQLNVSRVFFLLLFQWITSRYLLLLTNIHKISIINDGCKDEKGELHSHRRCFKHNGNREKKFLK